MIWPPITFDFAIHCSPLTHLIPEKLAACFLNTRASFHLRTLAHTPSAWNTLTTHIRMAGSLPSKSLLSHYILVKSFLVIQSKITIFPSHNFIFPLCEFLPCYSNIMVCYLACFLSLALKLHKNRNIVTLPYSHAHEKASVIVRCQ